MKANPWNPNVVDPINQEKLQRSLQQNGLQKAILIRTLPDGSKQILDGWHRVQAAIQLGWKKIYCVDLGAIPDTRAKIETLTGNSRFGEDDPLLMANLLSDPSLVADDIISTLPFDEAMIKEYFEHTTAELDLDDLGQDSEISLDLEDTKPARTHQILRFKLSIEDATTVTDYIARVKAEQQFNQADELTNAGDALMHIINQLQANG